MLPEPLRLLIAAYAADDLSPRRRKAAVRLLRHSREARQLLRALAADRKGLRSLPKSTLPADFAERVVGQLPIRAPATPRTALPASSFSPRHLAAAFAVAVAVGLGGWSLLALNSGATNGDGPRVVTAPKAETAAVVNVPEPVTPGGSRFEPVPYDEIPSSDLASEAYPVPQPKAPPRDVLTAPAVPKLETVQVIPPRLTLVLPAQGLDSSDSRAKLLRDLGLSEAHRIDLFARDTARGLDRLRGVLREKGVRVSVEAVAAEAHKRQTRGQTYVVFCEELTATEWVALLGRLAAADRRAEERRAGDGQFAAVAVMALASSDQKDLVGLVGVDVSQPLAKPKAGAIDVRKPLADSTAQQVVEALDKAGPGRTPGDKAAIALSASPPRANPATSAEVRAFLSGRRERAPAAIAVMVVVRLAG